MKPDLVLYRFVRAVLHLWSRLWFRLSMEGLDNLPLSGPFVLAPVHRSNIDFLLVSAVTTRRMRYMGKDSLFKTRPFTWFITTLGAFPVHRGSADREAMRRCIAILDGGDPLVIFPEGARQSGAIVQDLLDGAAYIATRAGVPIVPVGIGGSERAMPKGAKWIRPRHIHIVVGPAVDPPHTEGGRTSRRAVRELTASLHGELQRLLDAAERRVG